jgi:hypothetical protein
VLGADGAVPQDQFDWLQAGLAQATADNRLVIVVSHHNSLTLENDATAVSTPGQPLIHAEQFIAMLASYPNVVAWLNGHTHVNTIVAHPAAPGSKGAGFWEITTASCADYPQQQQVVEIMDNRDGTLSLFCTVLDHLSPAEWTPGDFSQVGIASLSRQLASNDWAADPMMRRGSPLDRNVELLLPAPFDMARFTDAALSKAELARAAAALATTGGR